VLCCNPVIQSAHFLSRAGCCVDSLPYQTVNQLSSLSHSLEQFNVAIVISLELDVDILLFWYVYCAMLVSLKTELASY